MTETRTFDIPGWDGAKAFVAETYPAAKHEGMGYWRIPRVAHIYYGNGRVTVEMMRGHRLAELDPVSTTVRSTMTTSRDPKDLAVALGVPVQSVEDAEAHLDEMLSARAAKRSTR